MLPSCLVLCKESQLFRVCFDVIPIPPPLSCCFVVLKPVEVVAFCVFLPQEVKRDMLFVHNKQRTFLFLILKLSMLPISILQGFGRLETSVSELSKAD